MTWKGVRKLYYSSFYILRWKYLPFLALFKWSLRLSRISRFEASICCLFEILMHYYVYVHLISFFFFFNKKEEIGVWLILLTLLLFALSLLYKEKYYSPSQFKQCFLVIFVS